MDYELKEKPCPSRIKKNHFYDDILRNGFSIAVHYSPEDVAEIINGKQHFDFDLLEEIEAAITVEKEEEGLYRVEGPGIERLLGYTNMIDERGFAYFQRFLREKGIIAQLEALGITEGDTVQMYELEFDYYP